MEAIPVEPTSVETAQAQVTRVVQVMNLTKVTLKFTQTIAAQNLVTRIRIINEMTGHLESYLPGTLEMSILEMTALKDRCFFATNARFCHIIRRVKRFLT